MCLQVNRTMWKTKSQICIPYFSMPYFLHGIHVKNDAIKKSFILDFISFLSSRFSSDSEAQLQNH